jgi:hypothetical protein
LSQKLDVWRAFLSRLIVRGSIAVTVLNPLANEPMGVSPWRRPRITSGRDWDAHKGATGRLPLSLFEWFDILKILSALNLNHAWVVK